MNSPSPVTYRLERALCAAVSRRDPQGVAGALDAFASATLRASLSKVCGQQTTRQDWFQLGLQTSRARSLLSKDLIPRLPPELWSNILDCLEVEDVAQAAAADPYLAAVAQRNLERNAWRYGYLRSTRTHLPGGVFPRSAGQVHFVSPVDGRFSITQSHGCATLWQQRACQTHAVRRWEGTAISAVRPIWNVADRRFAWLDRDLFVADAANPDAAPYRLAFPEPAPIRALQWSKTPSSMLAVRTSGDVYVADLACPRPMPIRVPLAPWDASTEPRSPILSWSDTQPWLALSWGKELQIWDFSSPAAPQLRCALQTEVYSAAHIAWQPGRERLAIANEGVLRLWDVGHRFERWQELPVFDGVCGSAHDSLAWAPGGDLLAMMRQDELLVWQVRDDGLRLLRQEKHLDCSTNAGSVWLQWHPHRIDTVEVVGGNEPWPVRLQVGAQ